MLLLITGTSVYSKNKKAFLADIGICTGFDNAPKLAPLGYRYVEGSVGSFLVPDRSEEEFDQLLEQVRESPLPVIACNNFIPKSLKSTGPDAVPQDIVAYAGTALRRAQKAGVKIIVFGSGGSRNIPDGFSREAAREQFTDLCSRLAPIAAQYEVTIVLEPLNTKECNFINSVSEGGEIVEAVNHPNFRLLADLYHMKMDQEGPEPLLKYGHLIEHVHIAEKEGRTAPGVHGEDFTPYFKALKEIGYTGRISIECKWNDFDKEIDQAIETIQQQANLNNQPQAGRNRKR